MTPVWTPDEEQAAHSVHAPVIQALQTMRGIAAVTATTLVAEIGQFSRFENPRQLMSYAGLVPKEYSSGSSRWQGSIRSALIFRKKLAANNQKGPERTPIRNPLKAAAMGSFSVPIARMEQPFIRRPIPHPNHDNRNNENP